MGRARVGRNTGVTGVTANDVNGLVTIYATTSGLNNKEGTLYKIADASGVNGTLSGVPQEIAKAPVNEAWRGVAFAPGTTIGSGGTPPQPPSISAAENALAAAVSDPTNPTMPITVADPDYAANELTVTVALLEGIVAPVSEHQRHRQRERTDAARHARRRSGITKLTVTVEDARRRLREHADHLRRLGIPGRRQRPLLLQAADTGADARRRAAAT